MNEILATINKKNNINLEKISAYLKKNNSFSISGLTSFLRLLLLAKISSEKQVVFVTNTEQTALKYKHDLEKLFNIDAKIFPYQDISIYDGVAPNLYKYSQQVEMLRDIKNTPLLLVPVKALLEKFPTQDFFQLNSSFSVQKA